MTLERRNGRRKFLSVAAGVVAAGAAVAMLPKAASKTLARGNGKQATPATRTATAKPTAKIPAFFRDLSGVRIDRWTVARVAGLHLGAVAVVLEAADGDRYQVDVLARDASGPAGVGNTRSLSVFVANRGDGSVATAEEHGLGAMALASVLAAREARGAKPPTLLTFAARLSQHPRGTFSVPV